MKLFKYIIFLLFIVNTNPVPEYSQVVNNTIILNNITFDLNKGVIDKCGALIVTDTITKKKYSIIKTDKGYTLDQGLNFTTVNVNEFFKKQLCSKYYKDKTKLNYLDTNSLKKQIDNNVLTFSNLRHSAFISGTLFKRERININLTENIYYNIDIEEVLVHEKSHHKRSLIVNNPSNGLFIHKNIFPYEALSLIKSSDPMYFLIIQENIQDDHDDSYDEISADLDVIRYYLHKERVIDDVYKDIEPDREDEIDDFVYNDKYAANFIFMRVKRLIRREFLVDALNKLY